MARPAVSGSSARPGYTGRRATTSRKRSWLPPIAARLAIRLFARPSAANHMGVEADAQGMGGLYHRSR